MLKTIRRALVFMSPQERAKYYLYLVLRSLVALFDLIGILAIGFLATSVALFITQGSDPGRVIEFAGVTLPAITAQTLPIIALAILMLFIGKALTSIILTRKLALFLAGIEARAAKLAAAAAFQGGLSNARKYTREEIYFAVQSGSPAAFNIVLNATGSILAEGLLFALVIGSFFLVDPSSAVGAVVYFSMVALVIQFFIGRLMQSASRKSTEGAVEANSALGDLSEVLREASILDKKEFFFERIYRARLKTASSFASQYVLAGMPRYIVETALIIAITLFVLAQSASGDIVQAAGSVGVFLSGGLRLTASLLPMQGALLAIKQSIPPAERALDLLESVSAKSTIVSEKKPGPSFNEPVEVKFKNVYFKYPGSDSPALSEINIEIKPGQQAALIGPSGAGKSTIADLVLGLLNPTSGEVQVAGMKSQELIDSSPGRLAYVPQKPGMVSGTIESNIALGVPRSEVDESRMNKAIRNSHLEGVIKALPEGIHSDIGKRKDELSGGQLQRIGLARALYSEPGLLVMDEATSALDAESENEINKALDEMRGSVTVVMIAHRLNTVQRSDIVFLIEDGRITASGTFPELLQTNSTVQNLAKLMAIESSE
jgi:ATP-binding cassette subfamily C protein